MGRACLRIRARQMSSHGSCCSEPHARASDVASRALATDDEHSSLPPARETLPSRRKQSSAHRRTGRVRLVQSGHEVTREAGYRSPRQSGIAPLCLARTGKRPRGRRPLLSSQRARGGDANAGRLHRRRVDVPCVAPSPARITEPVLRGHPFAQRHEVASRGFRLRRGLCRPLGADAPRNAELRGDLAGSRLRAERKYVKRIHARDAGKAGRQFAR